MDKWQQTVCAIALWANGYTTRQVAEALNVDADTAQDLLEEGASAQAAGKMGHMKQGPIVVARDPREISEGEALISAMVPHTDPEE